MVDIQAIVECIAADIVSEGICAARGLQVRRKDKDLMRDTGGITKNRRREPDQKPPRDDSRERYREKTLRPDERKDKNKDDREVKNPTRKKSSISASDPMTTYDVYVSKQYFPKEMWPKAIGSDVMYSWRVRAPIKRRSEAARMVWEKERDRILGEINPWAKRVSLNVSGGSGVRDMERSEKAERLSPIQVHPVLKM